MTIPGANPAGARVLLSQKEALALAFGPAAKYERKTAYLTDEQVNQAEKLAKVRIESRVWSYYAGRSTSSDLRRYAYFETHTVRTMPETFMAVLKADGTVDFVELLAFLEPDDYQATPRWLEQFRGKPLDDGLMVRRTLRNMTGATLTSEALTDGVRRIMAVHRVLHP